MKWFFSKKLLKIFTGGPSDEMIMRLAFDHEMILDTISFNYYYYYFFFANSQKPIVLQYWF